MVTLTGAAAVVVVGGRVGDCEGCEEGREATKVLQKHFIFRKSLRGEIQLQQSDEIKSKLCSFTPPSLIHTTCAFFCIIVQTCARKNDFFKGGGGVACTVRNVRRHQLTGEATTTTKKKKNQAAGFP